MRMVYVAYGNYEEARQKLTSAAKPFDALRLTGFDLYLEISPRQWIRAVDLPKNHPANIMLSQGGFKAGLTDANGQTFTILNAFSEEHRKLAAQHGLYINVPYTSDKREELLKRLENIREQLETMHFQKITTLLGRIDKIKARLEILKGLELVEKEFNQKEKAQAVWDGAVNDVLSLADALEELSKLMPNTGYEREAFQQALARAKREAAFETSLEESLFLNPKLLSELRKSILEDFT